MLADKNYQIDALRKGTLEVKGQFLIGSNYSFLVSLEHGGSQFQAIYKPEKGGMPLWDFPADTLANREVAAFLLSESLSWDLVPPTIIRRKAAFGRGSLQIFVPHNPEENYFTFEKNILQQLRPTALFDLVINNADRKGSHILIDESREIRLIDQGLCFHTDPKLRTVVWDFAGQPIPTELLKDIGTLREDILNQKPVYNKLKNHLSEAEIRAVARRIQVILDHPVFPDPDPKRRPFPWPLV